MRRPLAKPTIATRIHLCRLSLRPPPHPRRRLRRPRARTRGSSCRRPDHGLARSSIATPSGRRRPTSRSTHSSSRTRRAPWSRTSTATGSSTSWPGSRSHPRATAIPRVVAAIQEAAGRFLHICGSDFYYDGMAAICERLGRTRTGHQQEARLPDQLRHRSGRRRDQARAQRHPPRRHSSPSRARFMDGRTAPCR